MGTTGGVSVEFVNTGPCCSCTLLSLFATKCLSTSPLTDWQTGKGNPNQLCSDLVYTSSRLYKYVPMRQNPSETKESKRSTEKVVCILPIVKGLMSRDGCFLKDYKGSTFVRVLMV